MTRATPTVPAAVVGSSFRNFTSTDGDKDDDTAAIFLASMGDKKPDEESSECGTAVTPGCAFFSPDPGDFVVIVVDFLVDDAIFFASTSDGLDTDITPGEEDLLGC